MKLTEWLQKKGKNENATFIIAKAVKRDYAPGYDYEYKTVPIRTVWEWLQGETGEKYIVIKADHPPIDITGVWQNWYLKSHLVCAMVTTEQDVYKMYNEKQAKEMIEFWDSEVRK